MSRTSHSECSHVSLYSRWRDYLCPFARYSLSLHELSLVSRASISPCILYSCMQHHLICVLHFSLVIHTPIYSGLIACYSLTFACYTHFSYLTFHSNVAHFSLKSTLYYFFPWSSFPCTNQYFAFPFRTLLCACNVCEVVCPLVEGCSCWRHGSSSFTKSFVFKVFSVQTKTQSQRFQIPQVWRAFSKNSVIKCGRKA